MAVMFNRFPNPVLGEPAGIQRKVVGEGTHFKVQSPRSRLAKETSPPVERPRASHPPPPSHGRTREDPPSGGVPLLMCPSLDSSIL